MKKNKNVNFFNDLKSEIEGFVNISVEISDRIEEILKMKNMTQRDLAHKLEKSESEISKWLSGTHNFTIKSLAKLESILDDKIVKIPKNEWEDLRFVVKDKKDFLSIEFGSGQIADCKLSKHEVKTKKFVIDNKPVILKHDENKFAA